MIRPKAIRNFRRVLNLETQKEGDIIDHLSAQFTVHYENGSFGFLFYADEGTVWKRVGFCYCAVGGSGNPCISRAYCDVHREEKWSNGQGSRVTRVNSPIGE